MYSIAICSKDDGRFSAVSANLKLRFGNRPHEIIRISDARSMAEGYNRAVAQARRERLIFCHDDIEILNPEAIDCLDGHLGRFDIVGIAGTDRMTVGSWAAGGPLHTFGQVAQLKDGELSVFFFGLRSRVMEGIQAVDGVFFATNRKVVEKIKFDEQTFDGFHLYDMDFSFSAYLAGFQIAVACDIHLLHSSMGSWDAQWQHYGQRFHMKYAGKLYVQLLRRSQPARIGAMSKEECAEVMQQATPK
jgi:hypothetical protein